MEAAAARIRFCDFHIQELVKECKKDLGRDPTSLEKLEQQKRYYEGLKAKFLGIRKWMESQALGAFWYCLVLSITQGN
jgi:hypothetical protein